MDKNILLHNEVSIDGPGELKLNTPFNIDFKEIEKITIEQSDKGIKSLSIYPNGCIVYTDSKAESILLRSNFDIVKNDEDTYTLVEPK